MIRRFLSAALLAGLLAGSGAPARAESVDLTLDEARRLAMQAALAGNVGLAADLAAVLLKEDPEDPAALLAMSTALLARGEWDEAYRNSRLAFRLSEDERTRYNAARVASTAAVADRRLLHAQFWLRRAADVAPDKVSRGKAERNFRLLRSETPFSYRFDASLTPSSNVNGGADSPYNVIDGVPLVGLLSGSAQALSGYVGQSNLRLSYRIDESAESITTLNAGLFLKHVWLSDEAKAQAPGYDADRLNATSLSFGLSHAMKVGERPGTLMRFDAGMRQHWQGGNHSYIALTFGTLYTRLLTEKLRLTAQAQGEKRFYTEDDNGFVASASAGLSYRFGNGDRLSATVGYTDSTTPRITFDSRTWVGRVSYALGKPVLSMNLSAGIGASLTDYPDYSLGFIPVPGGRQDEAIFFDIDATFTNIEYAGFSPSLRVRRTLTDSNVSRFDTEEWAVSVGIESNF